MLACWESTIQNRGETDGSGLRWQQEPGVARPHFGLSLSPVGTRSWDWILTFKVTPNNRLLLAGPQPHRTHNFPKWCTIWGTKCSDTRAYRDISHLSQSRQQPPLAHMTNVRRGYRSHGTRWQNSSANINLVPPACPPSLSSTCGLFGPEYSTRDRE